MDIYCEQNEWNGKCNLLKKISNSNHLMSLVNEDLGQSLQKYYEKYISIFKLLNHRLLLEICHLYLHLITKIRQICPKLKLL